jgi:hypothetical protein
MNTYVLSEKTVFKKPVFLGTYPTKKKALEAAEEKYGELEWTIVGGYRPKNRKVLGSTLIFVQEVPVDIEFALS